MTEVTSKSCSLKKLETHGLALRSQVPIPPNGRIYLREDMLKDVSLKGNSSDSYEALCIDQKHYFIKITPTSNGNFSISFPRWGPKYTIIIKDINDVYLAMRGTYSLEDGLRPGSNTYEGSHSFASTKVKKKKKNTPTATSSSVKKRQAKSQLEKESYGNATFGAPFKKRDRSLSSGKAIVPGPSSSPHSSQKHQLLDDSSIIKTEAEVALSDSCSTLGCNRSTILLTEGIVSPVPISDHTYPPPPLYTAFPFPKMAELSSRSRTTFEMMMETVVQEECRTQKADFDHIVQCLSEVGLEKELLQEGDAKLTTELAAAERILTVMINTKRKNVAIVKNKDVNPQQFIELQCMQSDCDVETALESLAGAIQNQEIKVQNLAARLREMKSQLVNKEEEISHMLTQKAHILESIAAASSSNCQPALQDWIQETIESYFRS